MRVIGTAGHVDHGKSTLVKRLTGIDPDRLAEEKKRSLTIDLGFAWLDMPNGETVGVVDVPGHRDFIENMLAGVGGIDAVLFIIAADEGVMPQTREHLAILDLLDVQSGLIVITKVDMIDDPDWLELVEMDVRDATAQTSLADAPLIRVSAHTGEGIDTLLTALEHLLTDLPARADINQPYLPVDRVFTMSGFGTVVTGTLLNGRLTVGDEIEFQPSKSRGRIRGLQSYLRHVDVAYPGSRVAVNVTGVNRDDIVRGEALSFPNAIKPTSLIDAYIRVLPDVERPLKHNVQIKVFAGAAEAVAHIRLLDSEQINAGEYGWIQLRLETPMPVIQSERFILRHPSPPRTVGGGLIVDPHPAARWKRFRREVIDRLVMMRDGTPAQRVVQAASVNEPVTHSDLMNQVGYPLTIFEEALESAVKEGLLLELVPNQYISIANANRLLREITDIVARYHENAPLRIGMPREELRSRLKIKSATLSALLARQNEILSDGKLLRHHMHEVRFNPLQKQRIDRLLREINTNPYAPPSTSEAVKIVGDDVLRALLEMGELVQVQPEVIFTSDVYQEMVDGVTQIIKLNGRVDAKTLRDHFNTSRKYAIGLLEHLDSIGITRRNGDYRVLVRH